MLSVKCSFTIFCAAIKLRLYEWYISMNHFYMKKKTTSNWNRFFVGRLQIVAKPSVNFQCRNHKSTKQKLETFCGRFLNIEFSVLVFLFFSPGKFILVCVLVLFVFYFCLDILEMTCFPVSVHFRFPSVAALKTETHHHSFCFCFEKSSGKFEARETL